MTAWQQREALAREFHQILNRAGMLYSSLNLDELQCAEPKGTWCPLDCLEHLNLTVRGMQPLLKAALETARALPPHEESNSYHLTRVERLFLWVLEPPYRLKVQTPETFRPGAALRPAHVKAQFDELHQWALDTMMATQRLPLDRVRIESPFRKGFHYSLWAAFRILTAHCRRHLWQAEQVRERMRMARPRKA